MGSVTTVYKYYNGNDDDDYTVFILYNILYIIKYIIYIIDYNILYKVELRAPALKISKYDR